LDILINPDWSKGIFYPEEGIFRPGTGFILKTRNPILGFHPEGKMMFREFLFI
jgi:hypothetical protein